MKSKTKSKKARSTGTRADIPTHAEIALRATAIWQERGCIEGQDTEIWLEAESQLNDEAEKTSRVSDGPRTIFDEDRNPTHEVEKRLAEIVSLTGDRSATSL